MTPTSPPLRQGCAKRAGGATDGGPTRPTCYPRALTPWAALTEHSGQVLSSLSANERIVGLGLLAGRSALTKPAHSLATSKVLCATPPGALLPLPRHSSPSPTAIAAQDWTRSQQ